MGAAKIALEIALQNKQFLDELKKSQDQVKKFTEQSSSQLGGLKTMFASLGSAVVAKFSKDAVVEFIKLAGEVSTVESSFAQMMISAGKSGDTVLASLQKASGGTISTLDAMKATNQAVGLMGTQVIDKLPKMAEIATAAARMSGKKVSEMMNDIIVASGRQSVQILDNLNISSKEASKFQDEYARSLGKTRDQLNDTEKSQAFFYAVMKAGEKTILTTSDGTQSLGEKLQVLEARYDDVKNAAAGEFGKSLDQSVGSIKISQAAATSLGKTLGNLASSALDGISVITGLNRVLYTYSAISGEANKSSQPFIKHGPVLVLKVL